MAQKLRGNDILSKLMISLSELSGERVNTKTDASAKISQMDLVRAQNYLFDSFQDNHEPMLHQEPFLAAVNDTLVPTQNSTSFVFGPNSKTF